MFRFIKERRRTWIRQQPCPDFWQEVFTEQMPLYARLPMPLRKKLHTDMQVFLAEKHFEGCGGLHLTDAMRVTVAAHACFLLLGRDADYYPRLQSILLYPDAFQTNREEENEFGLVEEVDDIEEGESWDTGAVVLSWKDILRDTKKLNGRNVLLHEFAHQLEDQGEIGPLNRTAYPAWEQVLQDHFAAHQQQTQAGKKTFIDPYGAEALHEFFAVTAEVFFEKPEQLHKRHPKLYQAFCQSFCVSPLTWQFESS